MSAPDARPADADTPCPPVPPRSAEALDGLDHVDYLVIYPDGRLAAVRTTVRPGEESLLPVLQLGVGGLIERVSLRDDLDAWVNEEGLVFGLPFNPVAAAVCNQLAAGPTAARLYGPVLVIGTDGESGVSLTGDQQRQIVEAWQAATSRTGPVRPRHRSETD